MVKRTGGAPIARAADQVVATTMRAIRRARRMSATEVARAMGMAVRSYEHLEAGTGRVTYERVVSFAQATDSDAVAILLAPGFGGSDFALRCADNKLLTIMLIAMRELDEDLGADVTFLEAGTLVGGFTRLARELAKHVRSRETFAEEWLRQGVDSLTGTDRARRARHRSSIDRDPEDGR